jgi:hypothetical protein
MTDDHLIATDDHLCERLRTCTLCGRPAQRTYYTGIWAQSAPPHTRVAYLVCLGCHSQPRWSAGLHALLAARYVPGKAA